jgi:GGDEF domain-containing protein
VISIKKYLAQDTRADRTLVHAVRNLVQGIGQHAIAGEADDWARFRQKIGEISAALAEESEPERLLGHTDSVLKELEEYNRLATWFHRFQTIELQNMVKMLASTVGTISSISQANGRILGDIERQVAVISELDNVRTMKAKLSNCLTDIREQAQRQQLETGKTIQELRSRLDRDGKPSAMDSAERAKDVVTGLPLRDEAEAALIESANIGSRTYAAAMVFDRLQLLNARFGRQAGDEILVAFIRMVQSHLNPEDRLFRWDGPVIVVLLPRQAGFEQVRREIGDIIENKLEHTIQTESRSVLIPIAARWNLFPVTDAPQLIVQKIDEFAASASVRM